MKLLLSTWSFLWIIMFFIIWRKIDIPFIDFSIIPYDNYHIKDWVPLIKYIIIIFIVTVISFWSLWITRFIKDKRTLDVKNIKPIEWTFLPTYLGLFLASLSFESNNLTIETIVIFCILYIFWLSLETMSYFNPFWLLLWYRFYEVEDIRWNTLTLIIKKKNIKNINNIQSFDNLIRVNEFTFLQK